jgi:hypothetical protein
MSKSARIAELEPETTRISGEVQRHSTLDPPHNHSNPTEAEKRKLPLMKPITGIKIFVLKIHCLTNAETIWGSRKMLRFG